MHKSINGGRTWNTIFPETHPDQHALCINPQNNNMIIAGNDGGVYISQNGGSTYKKSTGLPVTQFYTCEIDYSFPDRLYGGTQDNGTVRTIGKLDDWAMIFGGDGFKVLVDPLNNNFVYAEAQYGSLGKSTDGGRTFADGTGGISFDDRQNWNTPVVFHPLNPSILFYGSNRLYKSSNRASSWSAISPDLTKNSAQNNLTFGTITTISVSPIDEAIIYVGTDDGNVQVTADGGINWVNVSLSLPNRWVTNVSADPNDANTAYISLSGYRFGENIGHLYKTTNLGDTWIDISGDLPDIPVNDLIVDPFNSSLYIATDIGVFYSTNEGLNWEVLGTALPNVVITDLTYHSPTNLLVAASYGRGMYKISLTDELATSTSSPEEGYHLSLSAYPNPFSEKFTLTFTPKRKQFYTISIFDLAGRLVKESNNQELHAGTSTFEVDATQFPSGIYICKLSSGVDSYDSSVIKLIKQ